MDRVKEEERAHALVKVFAAAAELVEFGARAEQLFNGGIPTMRVERLVTKLRVDGGDETRETSHVAAGEKLTERPRSVNRRANQDRRASLQSQSPTMDELVFRIPYCVLRVACCVTQWEGN